MATAAFAALRYGETRPARFWWMSAAATLTVVAFARYHGGGSFRPSDALLLVSVVFTAVGYGMGAQLTRELSSVEVIAWAVLLVAPLTVPWALFSMRSLDALPSLSATLGLVYVGTISQLLAFVPWYTGLARGGVTTVSQVQLLQPFLTFVAAALLLDEPLPATLWVFGGLVALFSPYSWLEQFTPREAWLGGYEQDGQPVKSADALKAYLREEGFVLRREEEVPLVIREHARKYQYIVTHGMLWQRVR